ncbi:hypothetical protein [Saccharopolyspora karakumensis]|nr:hypothetical protein [Saccharopolyspora karakumensis]
MTARWEGSWFEMPSLPSDVFEPVLSTSAVRWHGQRALSGVDETRK